MLDTIEQRAKLAEAGRRLREDPVVVPRALVRAFETAEAMISRCSAWSETLEGMVGDAVLTAEEVDRCTTILDEIHSAIRMARAEDSDVSSFSLLEKASGLKEGLVNENSYVVDVDTSLFGDHVYHVPKGAFISLDETQLTALTLDLNELMEGADRAEALGSNEATDHELATRIEEAARLAGWAERTLTPGVLYDRTPGLVVDLLDRLGQIERSLGTVQWARELQAFEGTLDRAQEALSSLVHDRKDPTSDIRLAGWFNLKEEGKALFQFVRFLRGEER